MLVFPKRKHIRDVMRPEFLANYIAYNPHHRQVRASLQKPSSPPSKACVWPRASTNKPFDKAMTHLREAHQLDPARAHALVAEYGDALKTSSLRQFVTNYDRKPSYPAADEVNQSGPFPERVQGRDFRFRRQGQRRPRKDGK